MNFEEKTVGGPISPKFSYQKLSDILSILGNIGTFGHMETKIKLLFENEIICSKIKLFVQKLNICSKIDYLLRNKIICLKIKLFVQK